MLGKYCFILPNLYYAIGDKVSAKYCILNVSLKICKEFHPHFSILEI